MSGITNLITTFYDGTENGANIIRNRLKQHAGEHNIKIIYNRGSNRSYLDRIVQFYDDVESVPVDEWDYVNVNNTLEGLVSNNTYINGQKIIEITAANQVETIASCRMSYVYGVEVFCGNMRGEDKRISAPRMVDVSKLGNIKKAIMKVVEDGSDYTVEDIRRTIIDRKYENYNTISQKHVRTHVLILVEEELLEKRGRVNAEYGRKRSIYHITEKGRISMTLHNQKNNHNSNYIR